MLLNFHISSSKLFYAVIKTFNGTCLYSRFTSIRSYLLQMFRVYVYFSIPFVISEWIEISPIQHYGKTGK